MHKATLRRLATVASIAAASSASLLGVEALAQQASPPKERIEVTGSNIKRTDSETPSVVQIISREQIERSGKSNLAELLRDVPAIAGGSVQDFGAGSGFQAGNQTASLRGLGSVATLVLLNGRRIAPSPNADPNLGQGSGYNLNAIPLSAVERIEILKDGASAIYGSDAMAGVINIILRKDYTGGVLTLNHWQKSDGNYQQDQVSGAVGFGELGKDRWNVMLAGEYFKRKPVWLRDSGSGVQNDAYAFLTGRLTPTSALSYPANVRRETPAGSGVFPAAGRLPVDPRCPLALQVNVATGINECRWNLSDDRQLVAELEREGVIGRATYQVTGSTTAFLEAGFTRNDTTFVGNPPSLDAAAPSTWFNRAGQRFRYTLSLPVGHPDNPYPFVIGLRYRFADIGITHDKVRNDVNRVMGGLTGLWGGWDWETALLYTQAKRINQENDILYFPALSQAVSSGTYRFSGTNSQALLDSLHPELQDVGKSTLTSFDLRGSREIFNLPAGPVMVAAGVEARREKMEIISDPRTVNGDMLGLASTSVSGSRNVQVAFAELAAPVLKNVETQLAGRYDHYSDFGNAFTPKVGAKWLIVPELAARATWGKAFRAPSLFQISTSDVQAFNANIRDPVRCPNVGVPAPGAEAEDCARTISTLIRANPNLQPERAWTHSAGFVWAPKSTVSVSADLWYIHRTNFIDRFSSTTVIQNEFNANFTGGTVQRDPNTATWLPWSPSCPTATTAPANGLCPNSGPILSTVRRFDNFGDSVVRGVDVDALGRMPLGEWGSLRGIGSLTYYDKILWQIGKNVPYVSGAGNFYIFEAPRYRASAEAVWEYKSWEFLARYNVTGRWFYGDPTGSTPGGANNNNCYLTTTSATLAYLGQCFVSAWETWDAGITFTGIRKLRVGLQVQNLFAHAAPYDPNQTVLGFNPTYHNPYGRYWRATLSYTFK